MRKQEAIEYMRMYKGENVNGESHLGHAFDLSDEIIDMAIEALKYMADEEQFWSEQYQDIDDYPDTDGDYISRQDAIEVAKAHWYKPDIAGALAELPSVQLKPKTADSGSVDSEMPEIKTDRTIGGMIYRQDAIDALEKLSANYTAVGKREWHPHVRECQKEIECLPSAQPERRYTDEELRVFQHGISLSLLSKRSSQHWQYDEDTATEIKFLERLYEKVGADMRGEKDG